MSVAIVLLAAGGSARLGAPKQLLVLNGKSLLRHAAETALASGAKRIVVVLGAEAPKMAEELAGLEVQTAENPEWQQGMGGSVRLGLEALAEGEERSFFDAADGVLLMLCDQPLVRAEALRRLLSTFAANPHRDQAIVAAAYHETTGVPAVFGRAYFEALRSLPTDAGAKHLLHRYAAQVIAIAIPEAAVDVDTREQYEILTRQV